MKKINLTGKRLPLSAELRKPENEPEITNMMLDARYLRQSSSLIQEALQKGFDVLQLANGDWLSGLCAAGGPGGGESEGNCEQAFHDHDLLLVSQRGPRRRPTIRHRR